MTRPTPPIGAAPPIGSVPPALSVPREPVTPDVSPVLLARAQSEFDAGRIDQAIALLESTPRSSPKSKSSRLLRDAYNRRALTRYGADRIAEAIADMNRSLQIDPAQPEVRTQLARARERLERLKALQ
ncbi:MAG: tetratricopeptide repeat protein [Nitrospiria bacterium]